MKIWEKPPTVSTLGFFPDRPRKRFSRLGRSGKRSVDAGDRGHSLYTHHIRMALNASAYDDNIHDQIIADSDMLDNLLTDQEMGEIMRAMDQLQQERDTEMETIEKEVEKVEAEKSFRRDSCQLLMGTVETAKTIPTTIHQAPFQEIEEDHGTIHPFASAPAPAPAPAPPFSELSPSRKMKEIIHQLLAISQLESVSTQLDDIVAGASPLMSTDSRAILQQLNQIGVSVTHFPRYSEGFNLASEEIRKVLSQFQTPTSTASTGDLQSFSKNIKILNITDQFQMLGLQTKENGEFERSNTVSKTTKYFFNPLASNYAWMAYMNCVVPIIQRVLMESNPAYSDKKFRWMPNTQPLFINPSSNPKTDPKTLPQTPAHFTSYFHAYCTSKTTDTLNPLEHLMVYIPLSVYNHEGTTNGASTGATNLFGAPDESMTYNLPKSVIRVIPGFNQVFPQVVEMILKNQVDVETGRLANPHDSIPIKNPGFVNNEGYRLEGRFMDLFQSCAIDIPIHTSDNMSRAIILNPQVPFSIRSTGPFMLLPISVFPCEVTEPYTAQVRDILKYREFSMSGMTPCPNIKPELSPMIIYKALRRTFFTRGHTIEVAKSAAKHSDIMARLKLSVLPNQKHFFWANAIRGYPSYQVESDTPNWAVTAPSSQELETIRREMDHLTNIMKSMSFDHQHQPAVKAFTLPLICECCQQITDIATPFDIVESHQSIHYDVVCFPCIARILSQGQQQ